MPSHLTTMQQAARAGGEALRRWFGAELELIEKSSVSDFQTQADRESENAILQVLTNEYADYNIHAEESGVQQKGSEYTFYVDPLDGTNNFTLGIPFFSVSLALQQKETTLAAVIYNPITDQLFSAEKNSGAFLNGNQIGVNNETRIERLTTGYIPGYIHERSLSSAIYYYLHRETGTKRYLSTWSPAMEACLLAEGRTEGMIIGRPELYDILAAKLIIREAGGVITDWEGNESKDNDFNFVVANTPEVAAFLREAVRYAQSQSQFT